MSTDANPSSTSSEAEQITIYIGNRAFPCNRAVLANLSSYFKAMFDGNYSEYNTNRITLREVDPLAFEEILDGIDTGKINITPQNACRLLKTCSFLGLAELEKSCISFVKKNLLIDDLLEVCTFVHFLKEDNLFNAIVKHIAENFTDMFKTQDYSTLPLSIFETILSHKNLNRNEDAVLLAISKWAKKNSNNDSTTVEKLLNAAKLTNVKFSTLVKLLSNSHDAKIDESLKREAVKITCGLGEPRLKVYMKAVIKDSQFNTFISLVYSPETTNKWILADDFGASFQNLKTVVDGKCQYFLSYDTNGADSCNQFWMIENGVRTRLREPPVIAVKYDLAVCKNRVYLYCSEQKSSITSTQTCADCLYFYDNDHDKWHSTPKMYKTVKGASLVGGGNVYVYLVGGLYGPEFTSLHLFIQSYYFRTSSWYSNSMSLSTLPSMFCYGAACLSNGYIYASGSCCNKVLQNGFMRCNISTWTWEEVTKAYLTPKTWTRLERGENHVLIPYKDELYAIDNRPFSCVDKYDCKTGWHNISSLPKRVLSGINREFITKDVTAAAVVTDYFS